MHWGLPPTDYELDERTALKPSRQKLRYPRHFAALRFCISGSASRAANMQRFQRLQHDCRAGYVWLWQKGFGQDAPFAGRLFKNRERIFRETFLGENESPSGVCGVVVCGVVWCVLCVVYCV